jgi:hypothetical protein
VYVHSGDIISTQFLWKYSVRDFWDESDAAQFLARYKSDPVAMESFRRLLLDRYLPVDASRMSEDELLKHLASMLATGELLVALDRRDIGIGDPGEKPQAPAPQPSDPAPSKKVEEEANTFGPDHDAAAQADALRAAAEAGVPFCEECARAAAAAGSRQ